MGLLHQRLGNLSIRLLLSGDTANVWQEIELRVDHEPLCSSYQIYTINTKSRSGTPLNPKTPFKWVFIVITPDISYKIITKETTFANYLLIMDAY